MGMVDSAYPKNKNNRKGFVFHPNVCHRTFPKLYNEMQNFSRVLHAFAAKRDGKNLAIYKVLTVKPMRMDK